MESKINVIDESLNEIEVTLEYAEVKTEIEKEVIKKSKGVQIQGFRKGKAPLSIIKKMYGDALDHEASEIVANDNFWLQVKEQGLKPIGEPRLVDIKFEPGVKLSYTVQYDVLPLIEVKDYTNQEIKIPDFAVRDEEIEAEISYIKGQHSEFIEADLVEDKDYQVTLDLQRMDDDGKPILGARSENIQVDLKNPNVNADLIEKSIGKKVGDTFNFVFSDKIKVKDSEEENAEGVELFNYEATVKKIKKITTPELTEEVVKGLTNDKFSSEAELREDIRTSLANYYEQQVSNITLNKLAELVVNNNQFKAPRTLVHNMVHHLMEDEEAKAKKEGSKFDHHEAHHRLEKQAEWTVKWFLLKMEIAKKENLEITDAELTELAEKDAEKTGISVEKMLNYYKSQNYTDRLLDKKIFDFLKEKNNITKVDPVELSNLEKEEGK